MYKNFRLNRRAKAWIKGIKSHYKARPLPKADVMLENEPHAFKML